MGQRHLSKTRAGRVIRTGTGRVSRASAGPSYQHLGAGRVCSPRSRPSLLTSGRPECPVSAGRSSQPRWANFFRLGWAESSPVSAGPSSSQARQAAVVETGSLLRSTSRWGARRAPSRGRRPRRSTTASSARPRSTSQHLRATSSIRHPAQPGTGTPPARTWCSYQLTKQEQDKDGGMTTVAQT